MPISASAVRWGGLVFVAVYGAFIAWLFARQPQTVAEVTGGLASQAGVYEIDPSAFAQGKAFFEKDSFPAARAAFARADPASRDPRTQFYVAYSYYREGWGRFYNDDALFRQGLAAVDRCLALSPEGSFVTDDPKLGLRDAHELRVELQRGRTRDASDFNPLRVFRPRQ